jgi:hypothetical protein
VLSSVPFDEIVNVLCFAVAPRFENAEGRLKSLSASAGALHAVDVVFIVGAEAYRIDRRRRSLQRLETSKPHSLRLFQTRVASVLPEGKGAIVSLIGNLPLIANYYENPGSLLFRDAGALLQMLAMISDAYGLGMCQIGLLGREVVESLGLNIRMAIPLGSAMIGKQFVAD